MNKKMTKDELGNFTMDCKFDHKINLMVSKMLRGKAPKEWTQKKWWQFHKSFKQQTVTPYGFAELIWQGYAFTPIYFERRKEEFFQESWHIAFDFDNKGADLDYLMRENSFAWTFASFAYATPSSTDDHPKSRVVFIFDEPIRSPQRMRELYKAIAWRFNEEGSKTDDQCKDPLRLYYGSVQCEMKGNWACLSTQSVFDDNASAVDTLISQYNLANPPKYKIIEEKKTPINNHHMRIHVDRMLDNLRHAQDGEKHYYRNKLAYTIGGVVAAGQMNEADALSMLEDAATMSTNTPEKARKEIQKSFENGKEKPLLLEIEEVPNIMDIMF